MESLPIRSSSRRVRMWATALLFVTAVLGHRPLASALLAGPSRGSNALAIGDEVPDFLVTDLAGKAWKLSDLRKRTETGVVSLTFWCTFCHSCRMMDERFKKLAADFEKKAAVLGVDASAADSAKKVEEFSRLKKFTVPVVLDADGKVADLFGVRVTTTTVVIDKAGILRYRGQFGSEETPYAADALRAILEGKDPAVKETAPAG